MASLISEDGYCEKEIQRRMALGKKIFMDKKRLFTGLGKLNLELKKRIIKCLVCSGSVYCSAETWTTQVAVMGNYIFLVKLN